MISFLMWRMLSELKEANLKLPNLKHIRNESKQSSKEFSQVIFASMVMT